MHVCKPFGGGGGGKPVIHASIAASPMPDGTPETTGRVSSTLMVHNHPCGSSGSTLVVGLGGGMEVYDTKVPVAVE